MRYVWLMIVILIPSAFALEITEIHPAPDDIAEFVEVWIESNGTLTIEDNYASDSVNVTIEQPGPVLIADDASPLPDVDCPVYLVAKIGNGLANGGDSITVTLNDQSDSHAYTDATKGVSLSRCLGCSSFEETEPSPCVVRSDDEQAEGSDGGGDASDGSGEAIEEPSDESSNETEQPIEECEAPTIEAEMIHEDRIEYRVRSSEAYEYWIEDAQGETVRERASSETDSTKRYTPEPSGPEQLFVIHATTTCGRAERLVGFMSNVSCQMSEADVIDAVTEQIATYVCRPHIEQAAALEIELEECREPAEAMTSFYTRAQTSNETYTYRSKAKTNAAYVACAARGVEREGDDLMIALRDAELVNATPVLVAIENGSVIDVRFGEAPQFVGQWESERCEAPYGPDGDGPPGLEIPSNTSAAPPLADSRRDTIRREVRRFVNLFRTSRPVQQSASWLVPVSFGIVGLSLAIPRT